MRPSVCLSGCILVLVLVCSSASAAVGATPQRGDAKSNPPVIKADGDAKAGYVTVSWKWPQHADDSSIATFELQRARAVEFSDAHVVYTGPQTSSVISGLTNGEYHFRVRARRDTTEPWGPWSRTVTFTVQHHLLHRAILLMAIGATVFLAALVYLIAASRKVDRAS